MKDIIKKILQEEKNKLFLLEKLKDIEGTRLYHTTSTLRGLGIINSDSIIGILPSKDYLELDKRLSNTKTQKSISFTRDKNWKPDASIGKGLNSGLKGENMIFVVDKDKLKTKYKIEPFNYDSIDLTYKHTQKNIELEERVLTDKIHPLHKYIVDIIYMGDNPKIKDEIKSYLNKNY